MEKVNEIKKINVQIMSIKSEISKYEEMLKEYQQYRRFLEALTPPVSIFYIFSCLCFKKDIQIRCF